MDHVLSELRTRFGNHHQLITHLWFIIPKYIKDYAFSDLQPVLNFYQRFLESEEAVREEFEVWKRTWETADDTALADTAIDALSVCDALLFPNIYVLLKITATLPVISASAERSFSVLKRLKTYLRSTMGPQRLSGLAHMHIQRSLDIDIETVIDQFANSGRARRLNFIL